MDIIALANFKGGVGKTTLTITLAAALAGMDYKVGIADTDPQGNIAKWFGMAEEPGIYNLLIKEQAAVDLLRLVPRVQWWPDETEGLLAILPGNARTTTAGVAMALDHTPITKLREALAPLAAGLDFVILDTAPTVTELLANVYMAANYIIIPTETQLLSVNGALKTLATIAEIDERRLLGIVPTKHSAKQTECITNLETLVELHPGLIWQPIMDRTIWKQLPAYSRSIFAHAPRRSKAAQEAALFAGQFMRAWQVRSAAHA